MRWPSAGGPRRLHGSKVACGGGQRSGLQNLQTTGDMASLNDRQAAQHEALTRLDAQVLMEERPNCRCVTLRRSAVRDRLLGIICRLNLSLLRAALCRCQRRAILVVPHNSDGNLVA